MNETELTELKAMMVRLHDLADSAEAQGKNLFLRYTGSTFTPDEARKVWANGQFRCGTTNWKLRDVPRPTCFPFAVFLTVNHGNSSGGFNDLVGNYATREEAEGEAGKLYLRDQEVWQGQCSVSVHDLREVMSVGRALGDNYIEPLWKNGKSDLDRSVEP